jgi:hypothetical protein
MAIARPGVARMPSARDLRTSSSASSPSAFNFLAIAWMEASSWCASTVSSLAQSSVTNGSDAAEVFTNRASRARRASASTCSPATCAISPRACRITLAQPTRPYRPANRSSTARA